MNLHLALKNPNVVFASPETVVNSTHLNATQKRIILLQWKDQLHQLLIADDESMLHPRSSSSEIAECLRRVMDSMIQLPSERASALN